jgi:hypothetical protein
MNVWLIQRAFCETSPSETFTAGYRGIMPGRGDSVLRQYLWFCAYAGDPMCRTCQKNTGQ